MNNRADQDRGAQPGRHRGRTRSAISRHGPRGFTLIEILLSLAVTALVATVVAALLFSVSTSTASRDGTQGNNSFVDVVCSRINTTVRPAGRVLAQADGMLVFWVSDSDGN